MCELFDILTIASYLWGMFIGMLCTILAQWMWKNIDFGPDDRDRF